MKITEFAIKRPAGMTMIVMLFIVLGLVGYSRLGSDMFPRTDVPFVTIVSTYPGAGAQEIENQVVDPIEEAVSSLSGVKRVTSSVSEGLTWTTLEFRMGTDINVATSDTQKAIDAIMYKLPGDIDKPVIEKYDLNAEPVMTLVVSSDLPLTETYRLAKNTIQQRLATVPGVGKITIQGGREREIQVLVDKNRLEAYGLSINSVVNRLKLENYNIPGGRMTEPETEYTVRVLGQYSSLDEIRGVRIPLPTGGTVALRDLAEVRDSFKEVRVSSKLDGKEAVGLVIQKQSDAGIVETARAVRQEVAKLRQSLPKGVEIVTASDSSVFITNSLADTKRSLLEGVVMTGLVLLFFLREWRSLLIVMISIPTSIVSTFMMMYFFGYSFNMMSLTALSVCVGILVDDSIVVLENIMRHLKLGKSPAQAAIDGRGEIGMAAIAITLSDVVVFGPIAFMQGMVGQMFRQFGLTVVFATLFSLFISFTITPMLASKLFKSENTETSPRSRTFMQILSKRFIPLGDWVVSLYKKLLLAALRHRWKVVGGVFLGFILSLSLFGLGIIGSGFMTMPDRGLFYITMELAPGTSLDRTGKTFAELEARLKALPEVDHFYTTVGSGGGDFSFTTGSHIGKITVILTPKGERTRSVWQVADQVRAWRKNFPAQSMKVTPATIPGMGNEAPILVEITGPDQETLEQIAARVSNVMKATPKVYDVTSSFKGEGQPEVQVRVDRDRAAEFGLSVGEIAQAMQASLEGEVSTLYRDKGKEYDLRVQLQEKDRATQPDLAQITISNSSGQLVKLSQVADIGPAIGPSEIKHKNRDRLISITANTDGAVGAIADNWDKVWAGMKLPPGYAIGYYGDIENQRDTFSDLTFVLALSPLLVYAILVVLYESFLTPIIRMLSIPCGAIGALAALAITGVNLDMVSFIGIIMLDGLAAKNGTLLIDYTNTLMEQGLPLKEALLKAGTTRLRPIFMTSVTMIFGMLPTALAFADGAEIRKGMGVVLVGGLLTSTILTPILIPVAYTLIEDAKNKLHRLGNNLTKAVRKKTKPDTPVA